ncbi:hypothetical protein ACHWQZ_G014835 [Mnemiopsis leidyi]
MITAATAFLSSPSVKDHPDETKRNFLLNKGLTKDEIIAAFAKSRNCQEEKSENFNQVMDRCLEEKGFPKNKAAPTRPSPPILVVAAMSTAALGVVVYLYKLFRRYMWPWIVRQWRSVTAGEDEDPPDVPMKEIVSSHVYELHDTISTIKSALDHQQAQITDLARKDPEAVKDLRQEMESIKKLLLSKDSFPAAVPTQLPAWQIRRQDRVLARPAAVTPSFTPDLSPPKSEQITSLSPPKTEQITSLSPPKTEQITSLSPPKTEQITSLSPPKSEQITSLSPSKTEQNTSLSSDLEETTASEYVSHVIVSHGDISQDLVSRDSPRSSVDSSDGEMEGEIGEEADSKLYSECLGDSALS